MNIDGIGRLDWLISTPLSPTSKTAQDQNDFSADRDSVNISSAGEFLTSAQGPDGNRGFNIDDSLTPEDKQLVTAATGALDLAAPNGTHEINTLAMQIALDRQTGNLTGPVTALYLNGLKNSEMQTLSLDGQYAATSVAGGNQNQAEALASQGPAISFDVFDRALAFLAD